jgi:SpoVK/Ycf46/Vps4 family AAA+-type ATPase
MTEELFNSLPARMQDTYRYYCVTEEIPNLNMDSIILTPTIKAEVDKFRNEFEHREQFYKYGLTNINRVLSYGASGTGKTFLAKCFAAHYGLELFTVDLANIISSENAYSELASVFDLARYVKNSVIFLDECDQIARERGSLNNNPKIRQLINGLFKLMDSLDKTNICMAATNLEEQLDRAFVRRFDLKLKFYRPDVNFIDNTIEKFIHQDFKYTKDADENIRYALMESIKNYTGLSFAEIEIWVQRAEKDAILNGKTEFTQSEVYEYMMRSMGFKMNEHEKIGKYLYQTGAKNI